MQRSRSIMDSFPSAVGVIVAAALCAVVPAFSQSSVRVVHLLKGAPAVELHIDSAVVGVASVSEGEASRLAPVAPGVRRLTLTAVGAPLEFAVIDTIIFLSADSVYAVVLSGSFDLSITRATILTAPSLLLPDSTETDIRFVNLAIGLDTVDIDASPGGAPSYSADGIVYGTTTPFHRAPSGELTVRLARAPLPAFYRGRGYPTGGGATTIFLAGVFDMALDRFVIVSLADNDTNPQTPLLSYAQLPNEEGALRIVHAAFDVGVLDLIRDGSDRDSTPITQHFATLQRADLLGIHRFLVTRAGQGRANPIATVDVPIPADTATTLILGSPVSSGGNPIPVVLHRRADLSPAIGRSLLRIVDLARETGTRDVDLQFGDSGSITVTGLAFGDYSDYLDVASGELRLQLRSPEGTARFSGGILDDAVVTAIISGRTADSSLGIDLLVETNVAEQEPMIALSRSSGSGIVPGPSRSLSSATIFPNPVRAVAQVVFSLDRSANVMIELIGVEGERRVITPPTPMHAGAAHLAIELNDVPPGYYHVVIRGNDGDIVAHGPMVVMR